MSDTLQKLLAGSFCSTFCCQKVERSIFLEYYSRYFVLIQSNPKIKKKYDSLYVPFNLIDNRCNGSALRASIFSKLKAPLPKFCLVAELVRLEGVEVSEFVLKHGFRELVWRHGDVSSLEELEKPSEEPLALLLEALLSRTRTCARLAVTVDRMTTRGICNPNIAARIIRLSHPNHPLQIL